MNEPMKVGVVTPEVLLSYDGLSFLKALIAGELPAPPIAETLGFRLAEVEVGRAVFTGTPSYKHYNPINLTRALTDKVGPVFAEGRVVHRGRQIATAEGYLKDAAGKLYAHASTTCIIFPAKAAVS
jgi:acyl-coenzyme A thioesterase PaaI-like protein